MNCGTIKFVGLSNRRTIELSDYRSDPLMIIMSRTEDGVGHCNVEMVVIVVQGSSLLVLLQVC